MIIGLEGFGSIWSRRIRSADGRAAFYNTTGIATAGRLRHRSRIFGQLRFNETGGFNPNQIERNAGRVFEGEEHAESSRCVLLHHLVNRPVPPDLYLLVVGSDRTGQLQIDHDGWKSDGVTLLSLSEFANRQEAMLLMPVHSWIRGSFGLFVVERSMERPWRAVLELKA